MVSIDSGVHFSGQPIKDDMLIKNKSIVDQFSDLMKLKKEIDEVLDDPHLSPQEKFKKILEIRHQINALLNDPSHPLDPEIVSKYVALREEAVSRVQQFVPFDVKPPLPRPMGL